jgi:hypothetical protein
LDAYTNGGGLYRGGRGVTTCRCVAHYLVSPVASYGILLHHRHRGRGAETLHSPRHCSPSFLLAEARGCLRTYSERAARTKYKGKHTRPATEGGCRRHTKDTVLRKLGIEKSVVVEAAPLPVRASWWLSPSVSPGEARSDTPLCLMNNTADCGLQDEALLRCTTV